MRYRSFVLRLLLPATFGVTSLLFVADARAFERQWHAGADVGFADLFGDHGSVGWGAGGHMAYGLNDAFNALLDVTWSHHGDVRTNVASAALGAAYTLDVTRLVPYGGALVGGYRVSGDTTANVLGLQLVLGADYQWSRQFALGLELRWHQSLFTWSHTMDSLSYTTTFVRAEYLWGY
jgi:hypothetical protein